MITLDEIPAADGMRQNYNSNPSEQPCVGTSGLSTKLIIKLSTNPLVKQHLTLDTESMTKAVTTVVEAELLT